jgi:dephospho-CoA kinase
VIGLTGGMASGKSSAAAVLSAAMGCERIDADQICRELLEPGQTGWLAMSSEFGEQFFLGNQGLDRVRLRRALFQDTVLRQRINELLHPLVKAAIAARLAAINIVNGMVIVEVPLLFEAGWQEEFDIIVVVSARPEQCLERLMQRDQVSEAEAAAALAAQWPLAEKVARARYVIDNSGDWAATQQLLLGLAKLLTGRTAGATGKDLLEKNLDTGQTRQ